MLLSFVYSNQFLRKKKMLMHACMHLSCFAGNLGTKEQWRWQPYGKPFPNQEKSLLQTLLYGKPFPILPLSEQQQRQQQQQRRVPIIARSLENALPLGLQLPSLGFACVHQSPPTPRFFEPNSLPEGAIVTLDRSHFQAPKQGLAWKEAQGLA